MLFSFFCFATLIILGGLGVLLSRHLLYAAYSLVVVMLGVAGLFVLSFADFVAVVQIMVYIGGVVVLLIFSLLFTPALDSQQSVTSHKIPYQTFLLSVCLFGLLSFMLRQTDFTQVTWLKSNKVWIQNQTQQGFDTIDKLGVTLLTTYFIPFEFIGILLLVILVGIVYVIKK